MSKIFKAFTVVLAIFAFTGNAFALSNDLNYGGWSYDMPTDWDDSKLVLGDGGSQGLYLSGTSRYCGALGDSYAYFRNVLMANGYNNWVNWKVVDECNDEFGWFARICVSNKFGSRSCSTFRVRGWDYFENP